MKHQAETLFEIGSPSRLRKRRKPHYEWQVGGTPPVLGRHSLAKHNILSAYLQKYVQVLTRRKVIEGLKLTLVDGFAGGGLYLHPETNAEIPGSPIIMASSMQDVEKAVAANREKQFSLDVRYLLVEKRDETREFLKQQLKLHDATARQSAQIEVLNGSFAGHLDEILEVVKKRSRSRRVIFVLDQYGFTDVSMSDLRKIFSQLPNAEVILTIAIDWLIDYWSESNYATTLPNLGINLTPDFANQIKQDNPFAWRPIVQYALHNEFKQRSGAGYYTPFFIRSSEAHRAYWLLHFSGHAKARDVMTELHFELANHFQHFGGPGIDMLGGLVGFDPSIDMSQNQSMLSYEFDESAKKLTHEKLIEQLPEIVSRDYISVQDLHEQIANNMPGTLSMLVAAVECLAANNQLEIATSNGTPRRKRSKVRSEDIVRLHRQTTCFSFEEFRAATSPGRGNGESRLNHSDV